MQYWLLIGVLTAAYAGQGYGAGAAEPGNTVAGQFPDGTSFLRTEDVIYGRKHGTALTMDVYRPADGGRGVGIVWAASGGWVSTHAIVGPEFHLSPTPTLVKRGYTVFAVVMGSQPKFTIPEMLDDLNRALRFIRTHASDYGIDPEHIGITGGSAGAHLSLMQATAGDLGDPQAADPVDRASSRVQAVAGFFPPTDFLNYGKPGAVALGRSRAAGGVSRPIRISPL
jgi:acetyl esterase/lipase